MGFFKDLRDVTKQAKEIDRTWDAGAQARDGLARMRSANEWMGAMADGSALSMGAAMNGVDATATITEVRPTGSSVNLDPVLELDLLVMLPGRPPQPVTRKELVPQYLLGRAQAGATVNVRYDAASGGVFIDWVSPAR